MKTRLIRFSVIFAAAAFIWSGTALAGPGNSNFACDLLQDLRLPGFVLELIGCDTCVPPDPCGDPGGEF